MVEQIITTWSREDRDLLVELKTEMKAVRVDVKEIKEGLVSRVAALEVSKLDKIEAQRIVADALIGAKGIHDDHEKRLREVEQSNDKFQSKVKAYGAAAIIILGLLEFLFQLYIKTRN